MDRLIHVGQIVDVIRYARYLPGILQQALHFVLRSAIAQFQVVQHGVVLFCEALIGVLDVLHVGAHLVCVVRHIGHRHIGHVCRLVGVIAQTAQQTGRKAGGQLHIVIGRHPRRLVGAFCICNDLICVLLEQRLDAAYALLQIRSGHDGILDDLSDSGGRRDLLDRAEQLLPG